MRIKDEACGVCHSDALVKEGSWPGLPYPRVPRHEIAGRIDAVGADVTQWKAGCRVGVGWHGGHCFQCDPLPPGRLHSLPIREDYRHPLDGGHAEDMVVPAEAVASMPDGPARRECREAFQSFLFFFMTLIAH